MVAVITQLPFIVTLILSLLRWNVRRSDLGISYIGLLNFAKLLREREFYHVILNTVIVAGSSLALCTVLSIALALLLYKDYKGIFIVRSLIIMPYFAMDAVIGIVWKTLILNASFGFNATISGLFGARPIDFLGQYSMLSIIFLIVWQWTPFFFLIILAGLQNLSQSIVESAEIDGASGFNMLFYIKLPSIKGHIDVALLLGLINIMKVFGLVYVTTQGGPGVTSANLPYYVYRSAFSDWDMGTAASSAVIAGIHFRKRIWA